MISACDCPSDSLLHRHGCTLGLAGIAGDGSPARLIGVCPACASEIHGEALEDPSTPFCSVRCANTFTAPEIVAYLDLETAALEGEGAEEKKRRLTFLAERPLPNARDRVLASMRRRNLTLPDWVIDAMVVAIEDNDETPCLACAREACAQAGFGGIDREQQGHSCGPRALDEHRRFGGCAAYTLDGEPVTTLEDLLRANEETLSREQVEEIKHMMPGDSLLLGGGAGATFTLKRTR